jgi:hypothetical protein
LARNYGTMKTATAAAIPGITFTSLGRRAGGGSENLNGWATSYVVGIIWPSDWDRVSWSSKILGWHETPASQAPTGLWGVNVTLSWKLCTFMLPLSERERCSKSSKHLLLAENDKNIFFQSQSLTLSPSNLLLTTFLFLTFVQYSSYCMLCSPFKFHNILGMVTYLPYLHFLSRKWSETWMPGMAYVTCISNLRYS